LKDDDNDDDISLNGSDVLRLDLPCLHLTSEDLLQEARIEVTQYRFY